MAPPRTPAPQAQPEGPSVRHRSTPLLVLCGALAAAVLFVFGGTLSNDFVSFDDGMYVTENATVRRGLTPEGVRWAFTTFHFANWHPLTWLSHMADVELFGAEAGGHHATSLLLHALNAVLLLLILADLTGSIWRSAFAAALFALHPMHVESVAWVAERKDVLSTALWLLTVAAWIPYARRGCRPAYAAALALFALGLMAKPMLVTLPFTLLLLDLWPLGRLALPPGRGEIPLRRLLLEKVPFFALALASGVVTFVAQRAWGAVQSLEGRSVAARVVNAVWAYGAYLHKAVWPADLSVFYPLPREGHLAWQVGLAGLALAGMTAAAWSLRARAPYLLAGWLWFLGTLVPVIGIVQVGSQSMADRYTYVPLVGLFVAAAWGLGDLVARRGLPRPLAAVSAGLALVALSAVAKAQVDHWADSASLFRRALAVTPRNWVALNNLGTVYDNRGDHLRAMEYFAEAIRIEPNFADAHGNMAVALEKSGRRTESEGPLRRAAQLGSKSPVVWVNLGNALAREGRYEEALAHFGRALGIVPDFVPALHNSGLALMRMGRNGEALERFLRAAELQPDFADAHLEAAKALAALGRPEEAEERFRKALGLRRRWPEAHAELAELLRKMGREGEAEPHLREAVQGRRDPAEALAESGLALASQGLHERAAEAFRRASALRPSDPDLRYLLGRSLSALGRSEGAVGSFREALRLRPDFPEAHADLGIALAALGRYGEALGHYGEALRLRPGNAEVHNGRGLALAASGRMPEAVREFRRAVECAPDFAEAHNNLGAALVREGRTAEAAQEFREALRLRPDFADAGENLRRLRGAESE